MAYEVPGFSFTLPAGVDLSASLFRGLATSTAGKVILPGAGAAIIGVLSNKPKADEAATVVNSGIVQMESGAAVPLLAGSTPVEVDAQGRCIPRAAGVRVGWALEASTGAGIIIAVLLTGAVV